MTGRLNGDKFIKSIVRILLVGDTDGGGGIDWSRAHPIKIFSFPLEKTKENVFSIKLRGWYTHL